VEKKIGDKTTEQKNGYSLLVGGLVLMVLIWAASFLIAQRSLDNEMHKAQHEIESLGLQLSSYSTTSFSAIDHVLVQAALKIQQNWETYTSSPVEAGKLFNRLFSPQTLLSQVTLLDPKGRVKNQRLFDYNQNPQSDFSDIAGIIKADLNQSMILYRNTKHHSLHMLRALKDNEGRVRGFIDAKIIKKDLERHYQNFLKNSHISLKLYFQDKNIFQTGETPANSDAFGSFLQNNHPSQTRVISLNDPPEEYLINFTRLDLNNLTHELQINKRDILKNWRQSTLIYSLFGVTFSLLVLLLSVRANRLIKELSEENSRRKESESKLQTLSRAVEQSPVSIMVTDKKGLIEYVNPFFSKITGYQAHEVLGKNPSILAAPEQKEEAHSQMWSQLKEGQPWYGEFFNLRKNGEKYWESASISPIVEEDGEITHFVAVKEDITSHKEILTQLKLTAGVFDTASEAIMICKSDKTIERVNASFSDITGFSQDDVIGKKPSVLKSGRHDETFYQDMERKLDVEKKWQGEIWNRRKNGEIYPQWLSIKAITDDQGETVRFVCLFTDITHRKRNEERILYQASYDALTGLPNRTLFMDRLRTAIVRAERSHTQFALLFIDLDRFKHVNDTLGHAYGDMLLQEASKRLQALVRKTDTVARLGGDEFTVILTDLQDYKFVESVAESLLENLSAPYHLDNNMGFVSASIGITIFPNDGKNLEDLLKNADTAMYQAKENGRSLSQFFTSQMNEEALERRMLETALHQALEREEFALHYQPIIDAQSGILTSCEVLLRWHHPEHGNVYPDKFIPLAEDTGLILPIGEWVLERACFEAMNWARKNKTPPNVAVNMSSRQFQRENVTSLVQRTLEKTKLPPERLTLEITESLLIVDDDSIITQLNEIREMGVGLSIDDFGTGYSSLSYLRRFPVTTLKIDRSFILDLTSDEEAAAVVYAILSMAQSLKLKVVAEGVETQEQLERLRDAGCEYIQGYYYSPPVPIEAFRIMAQNNDPVL
jgi:diguanylate cyclase (GGDEF)-like protein/PAS domain S-box-containing protein